MILRNPKHAESLEMEPNPSKNTAMHGGNPSFWIKFIKGQKPKLHDLALSMGENKSLNLRQNFAQTFCKISCYWYPYQVLCWKQLERNCMTSNRQWYSKITPLILAESYRNMCHFMNSFLGHHPRTRMKMIHSIAYMAI
jgi:hypothetical protein